MKVKRAALGTIGTLHRQIGLSFKALTLSLAQPSVKDDLDKCFNDNLFDDSLQTTAWPRQYLAALNSASNGSKTSSGLGVSLAIPKSDLTAELEDDCIAKLVGAIQYIGLVLLYVTFSSHLLLHSNFKGIQGWKGIMENP